MHLSPAAPDAAIGLLDPAGRREKLATYPKPPIASRAALSQIQRFLIACSRLPTRRVRSLVGMAPAIIFSKRVLMAAAMCR